MDTEVEKYYKVARWNYEQMGFSAERAEELANQAIKVWFSQEILENEH